MRVLLLGKRGSLVLWLENLLTAFRRAGHEAAAFTVNGATPWQGLAYKLYRRRPTFDRWLADRLAQRLRGLRPDLVVA
ncbi:MAG TPA: hypothetical protein VNN09_12835, partial [Candidatus Competibacteraceae bacterium]|nr:hypothetical protein [Candidatus Competibacteraceae bacterium]